MSALRYWLWLSELPGLANQTRLALLRHFGSPESVFYADEGEILRLHVGAEDRFDGRDGHCHIICTRCGEIYDTRFPEESVSLLEKESGYRVSFRNAEFFGLCPKCREE